MMCYRDMTFCEFYKECSDGEGCYRALTEEVIKKAEAWMKDAPICTFVDKPKCFKEMKK
ncbi:MAG: hypothetical protein KAR06_05840 [Deltaproteobacteria bacterium]|nr:hypothetical protein [Deltaproteobacteria bacterium]